MSRTVVEKEESETARERVRIRYISYTLAHIFHLFYYGCCCWTATTGEYKKKAAQQLKGNIIYLNVGLCAK